MRTALLLALLPSLLLIGCDAASPGAAGPETAAPSQAWALSADTPALDIVFSTLTTRPGGVIQATFERPDDARLTLSSAHQPVSDQHVIQLEASGIEVEQAELLIRRIQDKGFVSVKSAQNLSEIVGETDREPQSVHYREVRDDRGNTMYVVEYDYEQTGANFTSDHTEGEVTVSNVGYRVRLDQHEGGFSELRIDGYDRMSIESMQALTAPEVRARVHDMLPASDSN